MALIAGETLKDRAMDYLRGTGGIAQLREFTTLDIPSVILRRLVHDRLVINPARGIYALAENAQHPYFAYAVEATSAPSSSLICLETSAYLQDLIARDPLALQIALPRGSWAPRTAGLLEVMSVQWKCLSQDGYMMRPEAGYDPTTEMDIGGRQFTLTSRARTVADLFAYRATFGLEVAIEALGNALRKGVSIGELEAFAEQAEMQDVMRPYLAGAGVSLNLQN